jgi:hypothetical protein
MMHGQKNIKLCIAEQAKRVYQYKNTKIKFNKNNAAIWYNQICRARQLNPAYANIKIKGTNSRCQRTRDAAICFTINQELKFQYAKKQQLNQRLYKLHLECATKWPTTWNLIQSTIDNIRQQMDNHYKHLHKKLDQVLKKKRVHPQPVHDTAARRVTYQML